MADAKLFVGGLSWNTDDNSLRSAFEVHGQVVDARVIVDRDSGKSRGFGFVTFANAEEAEAAKNSLNQTELDGREIRVDNASDRDSGRGGGGGGGGGGYRGGGRGGYGGGGGGGYRGERSDDRGRSSYGNRDRPYDRDNTRGSYGRYGGGGNGGGRRRHEDDRDD